MNKSGNVRASSYLHMSWEGNKIQWWISLEMSGPPPPCTPHRKGERATKFSFESDLNQFWIRSEPVLNQIWTSFESDLNQFWIRSESVFNQIWTCLTQTWNVQPSCRRILSITGIWLPSFWETLPWHLILAPRSHIQEKGDQINPLLRVFQKMKLIFSWSSRLSKAPKDLIHLARNMIPRGYN